MAKSFIYFNSWNIYSVPLIPEINYSLENLENGTPNYLA